jgi:hypothetical protein
MALKPLSVISAHDPSYPGLPTYDRDGRLSHHDRIIERKETTILHYNSTPFTTMHPATPMFDRLCLYVCVRERI